MALSTLCSDHQDVSIARSETPSSTEGLRTLIASPQLAGIGKVIVDVVIVGAGVLGLFLAVKLARLGLKIIIVEMASTVCSGPSTRNEGWLHNGTYHATSILDKTAAIEVARRCRYGHDQILKFAPEAVEDIGLPAYALLRDGSREEEIKTRWDEAHVPYRKIERREFTASCPEVDVSRAEAIFEVEDKAINTPLLYSKIVSECRRSDVTIITNAHLVRQNGEQVTLANQVPTALVESQLVVYTAGYGSMHALADHLDVPMPMRFWKSHLLITRRLATHGVFYLDPNEAAVMHHRRCSLVGIHNDAREVDTPNFEPETLSVEALKSALRRMFPVADVADCMEIACTKVDVLTDVALKVDRSLNIACGEPVKNHLWFLPGKMTEAPYISDIAANLIFARLHRFGHIVAQRPCDLWVSTKFASEWVGDGVTGVISMTN